MISLHACICFTTRGHEVGRQRRDLPASGSSASLRFLARSWEERVPDGQEEDVIHIRCTSLYGAALLREGREDEDDDDDEEEEERGKRIALRSILGMAMYHYRRILGTDGFIIVNRQLCMARTEVSCFYFSFFFVASGRIIYLLLATSLSAWTEQAAL